ncbi:MAG: hypothetical protein U1B83_03660, partial [Candidatus Cloacimonadaceae bacterium]|nr:hypothetical protein [Candidatus Cloacimonadaceae bacterium]
GNLDLDIAAHKLRAAMRVETFDRHLRKPALSAGLGGDLDLTLLRLKTDTLWRMVVLLDDGTDQEIYHATQIILPITDCSELFAGINLENRDYFPRQNTEILLGAKVTSGRLGFNPWLKLSRMEDDEVLMANLRVDWNFDPANRIGIFIAHTSVKDGARHASFGIQNSFRFDF